jgi:hypothetical protein
MIHLPSPRLALRRLPRAAAMAVVLASVISLAACRDGGSGLRVDGPFADKVNEYIPRIERALGVPFKTPPRLEVRTRDQVREFVAAQLQDTLVQRELRGQEAAYKVLGLIPDTLDLPRMFGPLLTEQIMGYYDPRTKVLYVVDGAPDTYIGITIMHELVHALQDQYLNLDSLQRAVGDNDRMAAAQAVIEGQATYQQAVVMSGGPGNIAVRLPGGWDQLRASIREMSATQPVFAMAPMAIQESLLFPYINGAEFVRRYEVAKRPGSPLDSMPVSTEQVMHQDAYFGATPDIPSLVQLPAVAGTVYENTMGEFGTRLFLYNGGELNAAAGGARGWDGDRYVVVRRPQGLAIAWVLMWDSTEDAAEFVSVAEGALRRRYEGDLARRPDGGSRITGKGRTAVISVRPVGDRTAIMLTDVPAGTSETVIDFAAVRIDPR